jgi:E3 ubiquitin-protein ligase RFWD2
VSSIEFDRDEELFATAGVCKKISIFSYRNIMNMPRLQHHLPSLTVDYRTKISCLSWSQYFAQQLASADYDGIVQVWDASTGQRLLRFEEHEKRAWSVAMLLCEPSLMASGSDDFKVKIWSMRQPRHSIATISAKANVCCVKFHPENSNLLAFGAADHMVHLYDLRQMRKEVFAFKGHAKAVSYVRFLSNTEIVSASTDNTLKLWDLQQQAYVRSFQGHVNEKNFVGLTSSGDYLACGSEDNSVYLYYKGLQQPIVKHVCDKGEQRSFVSAVAWRRKSDVVLGANSTGVIHLLKLC